MSRDCSTCENHIQDQHPDLNCQLCLVLKNRPNWKPMSKTFDAAFRPPVDDLIKLAVKSDNPVAPPCALDVQIGGQHYKSLKIQPVEFVAANGLDFFQGNILKYITRRKGDIEKRLEDLNKAKHYIDLYMDFIKKGDVK